MIRSSCHGLRRSETEIGWLGPHGCRRLDILQYGIGNGGTLSDQQSVSHPKLACVVTIGRVLSAICFRLETSQELTNCILKRSSHASAVASH